MSGHYDPLKGQNKKLHLCMNRKQIAAIKLALKAAEIVRSTERERAYLRWLLKTVEEQEEKAL